MSVEDLTCLVIIILIVFFVLKLVSEKKTLRYTPKVPVESDEAECEGMEDEESITLPNKRDVKKTGAEYLEILTSEIIGDASAKAHANYNAKRRAAGDHTLQLWGINDSKRGYSTNFVGPRPPRRVPIDPTAAMQAGTSDMSDYADPKNMRYI